MMSQCFPVITSTEAAQHSLSLPQRSFITNVSQHLRSLSQLPTLPRLTHTHTPGRVDWTWVPTTASTSQQSRCQRLQLHRQEEVKLNLQSKTKTNDKAASVCPSHCWEVHLLVYLCPAVSFRAVIRDSVSDKIEGETRQIWLRHCAYEPLRTTWHSSFPAVTSVETRECRDKWKWWHPSQHTTPQTPVCSLMLAS